MRTFPLLLALTLTMALPHAAAAADDASAQQTLQQATTELEALVHADGDGEAKAAKIQARVDALLDYHFITVAALGGPSRWQERCAERCAEVEALLGELIRRNYLARVRARPQGQVEILREHVRAKATKVDTTVRYTDKEGEARVASVEYVMHRVQGQWRVRDIRTEGASLAQNYRYEIGKIYARGGIDAVVETLKRKLAHLKG